MKINKQTGKSLAKKYMIDLKKVPLEEWIDGLNTELEHKDITAGDIDITAKIVIAHLLEMPDYYKRLKKMEEEGKKKWNNKDKTIFVGQKATKKKKEGGAITDIITKPYETLTNAFTPIKGYNNTATDTLNKYGNIPVSFLTIAKTPLSKLLEFGINAISLGKFNELKNKYGYDDLYHLSLIVNLRNAPPIIVEKNEVVTIEPVSRSKSIKPNTKFLKMPFIKPLTLNSMLNKAQQTMGQAFWEYSAFDNNCQTFIVKILESNGVMTPVAKNFIFQDVEGIKDGLNNSGFSYVHKVMRQITDMSSIASRLMGKGTEDKAFEHFSEYLKKRDIKQRDIESINSHFLDFINSEGIRFL